MYGCFEGSELQRERERFRGPGRRRSPAYRDSQTGPDQNTAYRRGGELKNGGGGERQNFKKEGQEKDPPPGHKPLTRKLKAASTFEFQQKRVL